MPAGMIFCATWIHLIRRSDTEYSNRQRVRSSATNISLGKEFRGTIYITANPFGAQVDSDVFYEKVVTFGDDREPKISSAPETVYQAAVGAHRENPDKRLMVHFMQPHSPYFGAKAEQLRERITDAGYSFWVWDDQLSEADADQDNVYTHLLDAAKDGHITTEELTEIYIENLEIVVEYVTKLAAKLGGKTIVTSDHGEMLEWKLGHGYGIYTEGLRKVPWVVLENGERRTVTQESPTESDEVVAADVDQQLTALGYK